MACSIAIHNVDGRRYLVWVKRSGARISPEAPRLIIPSFIPNAAAGDILAACLDSIRRYTPEEHEVWVVDNGSAWKQASWLLDYPGINVALSRTIPVPREERGLRARMDRTRGQKLLRRLLAKPNQTRWGSYCNGTALELGLKLIDPAARYVMPMHMDTMACREGWLSFLKSKLSGDVKAAGVRMETARVPEGVLHVLGYMVDMAVFRELGLDFMPRPPQYDVGDYVTVAMRDAGFDVFACRDTVFQPELIETIPADSPFRNVWMDRYLDDAGHVIFLHMGRAIPKAVGAYAVDGRSLASQEEYNREKRTSVEAWLAFARDHVLK